MKRFNFCFTRSGYILFLILLCCITGCTLSKTLKQSKQQQVTVQPRVLEVTGDNILFEVKAQIPEKMLRKKSVYSIAFVYRYNLNQEEPVGSISFLPGEFMYENKLLTITKQFSIPYLLQKNPGVLLMQGIARSAGGREKRTAWQELTTGLVTTSKLVVRHNQVNYAADNYKPAAQGTKSLTFYFNKGEADLQNSFASNTSVLKKFIEANYKTSEVTIVAGTSPESEEFKNPRLGWQRAQALLKYYKHHSEVSSYVNAVNSVKFRTASLPKSWDLFLKRIQQSALPEAEIQELLEILNRKQSNAERFKQISLLKSAEYLDLYVYPMLRFAEVKIKYTPAPKKDYEIYLLSKKIAAHQTNQEVLSAQELQYGASLTPLLAEKQKIYEAAIATSDHWQAYHNLGVVYLQMARLEVRPTLKKELLRVAALNLTYAAHRQPNALNFYHLASAHHIQGNRLEALQSYDYALRLGGQAGRLQAIFADKAALEIEIGQIDDALYSLQYAGTSYQNYINKGLCYLLKENYEQANLFYEEALKLKPNDALAYYSKAILAVRTNDENVVALNLKKAVQADKTFTQKAIEDLEFRAFLRKEFFQAALKQAD